MPYCGPVCAVPSCESAPVVGFGSAGSGIYGGTLGYGYGSGSGSIYGLGGGSTSAASLGVLQGVRPSCINQLPPAECVIQPPPSVVTIPGAILSASCEPVAVGGYTPCAVGGVGINQVGSGLYGGALGQRSVFGGRRGIFCDPCA